MREADLETALLDRWQDFLLEIGHAFCLEAQQKRLPIGGETVSEHGSHTGPHSRAQTLTSLTTRPSCAPQSVIRHLEATSKIIHEFDVRRS